MQGARRRRARPGMAVLAAGLLAASGAAAQNGYFEIPSVNGAPVDGCTSWQANCGQGGADQFCRTQGFASASQWSWAHDLRTWNIGSSRFCDRSVDNIRCGGLRAVTCTGSAAPAPAGPSRQQQQQGPWAGAYSGGDWGEIGITGGPDTYQGSFRSASSSGSFSVTSEGAGSYYGRWSGGGAAGNMRIHQQADGSLYVGWNTDRDGPNGSSVWRKR